MLFSHVCDIEQSMASNQFKIGLRSSRVWAFSENELYGQSRIKSSSRLHCPHILYCTCVLLFIVLTCMQRRRSFLVWMKVINKRMFCYLFVRLSETCLKKIGQDYPKWLWLVAFQRPKQLKISQDTPQLPVNKNNWGLWPTIWLPKGLLSNQSRYTATVSQ